MIGTYLWLSEMRLCPAMVFGSTMNNSRHGEQLASDQCPSVKEDPNRWTEIGQSRSNAGRGRRVRAALLLTTTARSPEMGRVQAPGGLRSLELAKTGEKGPTNLLEGLWPRERDRRRENGGGKALGGSG